MAIASTPDSGKSGRVPVMEPHHDLAHEVEDDDAWSESYYFNAYDPAPVFGLFTRIGIRPNEGTMDVGLSVWLPGGDLAEYRHQIECHELLEAMQRWRLVANVTPSARRCHPSSSEHWPVAIRLDATFDGLSPAVGSDGRGTSG